MRYRIFTGLLAAAIMIPTLGAQAQSFLPASLETGRAGYTASKFDAMMERHKVLDILPIEAEILCEAGDGLACGKMKFFNKVEKARSLSGVDQLRKIDQLFDTVPYVEDYKLYIDNDYWATPEEFLELNGGDCEDYAIAKYVALKELGWDEGNMKIVVLWDDKMQLHHAVLLVRFEGEEWILDNARPDIVGPEHLPHYTPLYAVNESVSFGYRHTHRQENLHDVASGP